MALAGVRQLTGLIARAALVGVLAFAPHGYTAMRAPAETGFAVRYAPGVMANVAHNRHIAPQPCMVAWTAARDADIGETWLRVAGPAGSAECLVVDLPRPGRDRQNLLRRQVVIELDYQSGARVCGRAWKGRAVECPVRVSLIK